MCCLYSIALVSNGVLLATPPCTINPTACIIDGVASLPKGKMSGCAFGAVVCKMQIRKLYIESLPLVPKDKRNC